MADPPPPPIPPPINYACTTYGPLNVNAIRAAIRQMQGILLAFPKTNIEGFQAINACGIVQNLVNKEIAAINLYICGLNAQITALAPFYALLSLLTDPSQIITWINNFIMASLAPQYRAYITYAEQAIILVAEIESLLQAIAETEANIKNCHITIPPITAIIPIPIPP